MSSPGPAASAATYWEERARRFAGEGRGLRAVCAYGMPAIYNASIDVAQRRALRPWLRMPRGTRLLDVGCGVGRWSRRVAANGVHVTGVDVSPTMIDEARRRCAKAGLADLTHFEVTDAGSLRLDERFDRVLAVTVLQHITTDDAVVEALRRMRAHLAPGGDIVLLEVAPGADGRSAEHDRLRVRDLAWYVERARGAGLTLRDTSGVDLSWKARCLPVYRALPQPFAGAGLALVTAVSFPLEAALGPRLDGASWHRVMVFEPAADSA